MDIEKRRSKLLNLGIYPSEMYVFPAGKGRELLILRRSAVDKLASLYSITFTYLSVTESSFGEGCNVTVVLQGNYTYHNPETKESKAMAIQAMGSANPVTAGSNGFISDIANKRARHKVILTVAGLYKYDIHSEEESLDFKPSSQFNSDSAFREAFKKMNV